MLVSEATAPMLPGLDSVSERDRATRWFSELGCVMREGAEWRVFVAGTLICSFDEDDRIARNVVLVGLAESGGHIGKLARAFEVSEQTVRNLRKKHARGGAAALVPKPKRPPRSKPRLNGRERRVIERRFELGKRPSDLVKWVEEKYGVKRSTVYAIHRQWRARRTKDAEVVTEDECVEPEQVQLAVAESDDEPERAVDEVESDGQEASAAEREGGNTRDEGETASKHDSERATENPVVVADARLELGTTRNVQHVGTWLMLAMVMKLGLYDVVVRAAAAKRIPVRGLRLMLDATVAALSIGERTVEGVRRIATPTARFLLCANAAPSAPWVRAGLGRVAGAYVDIQEWMARRYLAVAASKDVAVFYLDNHLRPYTGKFTVRRGWRMQDKRVVPGTTDYYVHDIDGRPVLRVTEASHGHLTGFLRPVGDKLRGALGSGTQIVLAFDRGGAFPATMAELRDAGIHFVTYERKPYAVIPSTMFEPDGIVRVGKDVYTIYEKRLANLGRGRGRVRRIAVLCPDGAQVNLLAVSDLPAKMLLEIMVGRWKQENGFKYGNERWGINQLDGRRVVKYAPDTVIPNPARRRLDNGLRIARRAEGDARCQLAMLASDDPRRAKYEKQVNDAIADQRSLLEQRPHVPKHVELRHSELARDLVHHTYEYKGLLDIVRIACANAESDCVAMLAPLLPRKEEAKKVLANLFTAPGDVRVTNTSIRVTLAPAATNRERKALEIFVDKLDALHLTLPADPDQRRLRFRIQK
jgi:hypothetical protein